MRKIDRSKPVLVTGGTGYLASWIVKYLLDEGLTVHATVRNLSNEASYKHLLQLRHHSPGNLKLFEADLLVDGAFDDAIAGCELVIHTASPFKLTGVKDAEKELVLPALKGVQNVFFSADASGSVKRIVLTSSIVAMIGDSIEIQHLPNKEIDESCWNVSSSLSYQPYPFSKTVAEQEAWRLTEKFNSFDLVVINPGLIIGPSLSKRKDSTSISLMSQICSGKFKTGVPQGAQAFVDVRDVAKAHVAASFSPNANGRHLTAAHLKDFLDIASVIKDKHPEYPVPEKYVPKWLFKLVGPFMGYSRKFIDRNIGYDYSFNNTYVKSNLKMDFLPFEQSVSDHFNQLVEDELIESK